MCGCVPPPFLALICNIRMCALMHLKALMMTCNDGIDLIDGFNNPQV